MKAEDVMRNTARNGVRWSLFMALSVALTACGSASPTAPSPPSVPQVAGSYAGIVTIAYPEIQRTLTCPATTVVNQTGAAISMAPLAMTGPCGTISIPLGDTDIDSNGSIGTETGTASEPSCGVYNYSASGGFFGREFRFSMTATSATCLNFFLTGTLTR